MSSANKTPKKDGPPMEENPITPPRPRIICPGCSTELTVHNTVGTTEAFILATVVDMKKLGMDCNNPSCPLFIEGLPEIPNKARANPNVEKYVSMAKRDYDTINAKEKAAKDQANQAAEAEASRIGSNVTSQWQFLQAKVKKSEEDKDGRSPRE
ncbi:hypothetical protein KVR01_012961 [Diaporthe batatas]|uniref:uncharacterized protein n=1 Tax=Diaporthe batatas TaxID=748121 RepID=UPI001D03D9FF|nr:uncharacterized protein KVR01_012961 [Diaporthe batatas]KAG8157253.1 hypothetical protein KVR01_012961 [Diaporthe batatas]